MYNWKSLVIWAGCLMGLPCCSVWADEAAVTHVTVRQRWPWSRLVDIDYVLTCDPTQRVDIAVAGFNGDLPLDLPTGAFSGDQYGVAEGSHRIVFDPTQTAYTNSEVMTRFRVALTPRAPALYLIVDLTKVAGEGGQIEYVYEDDLANGAYGTVATNPVAGVTSVIWTGVTNGLTYKTDKLVLRRVHSGVFTSGTGAQAITNDFYIEVFELTQRQRYRIMGQYNDDSYYKGSDRDIHPEERISYNTIRGATHDTPAINWPYTGASVGETSLLGLLRAKTGLAFDLPTSMQWEYACRAGTATAFNSGSDSESALNELGWHKGNSTTTCAVGLLRPNAWGIYDMHGNVEELCLDGFNGAETQRLRRNGSWYRQASYCAASYVAGVAPNATGGSYGLRVVLPLP